jgi:hypothetical protein
MKQVEEMASKTSDEIFNIMLTHRPTIVIIGLMIGFFSTLIVMMLQA